MGKQLREINWKEYNRELVKRGSITFWIDDQAIANWFDMGSGRGFQRIYSDLAIELLLILRSRFSLTLRETEGFAASLLELMKLYLPIPSYSTLSRRASDLEVILQKVSNTGGAVHVVVDSTGLKIFGEGEWRVRMHGYSKRRTWRKLHLCVDEKTNDILNVVLSENSFKDNEVFGELLDGVEEEIDQASGDGAYDAQNCWDYCEENDIHATIPPKKNSKISQHGNVHSSPKARDENLRLIRSEGRAAWKAISGYSRRSISETAMYRFKTIFGSHLKSRNFNNQATEAFIKCKILNQMKTPAVL